MNMNVCEDIISALAFTTAVTHPLAQKIINFIEMVRE